MTETFLLQLFYNAFCFEKAACSILLHLINLLESHMLDWYICPSENMLITIEKFKVDPGWSSHILCKGPGSITLNQSATFSLRRGEALLSCNSINRQVHKLLEFNTLNYFLSCIICSKNEI